MMRCDQYLAEFLQYNWQTLGVVYLILKGIAVETPWSADNKILSIIGGAFTAFRNREKPAEGPPKEE